MTDSEWLAAYQAELRQLGAGGAPERLGQAAAPKTRLMAEVLLGEFGQTVYQVWKGGLQDVYTGSLLEKLCSLLLEEAGAGELDQTQLGCLLDEILVRGVQLGIEAGCQVAGFDLDAYFASPEAVW